MPEQIRCLNCGHTWRTRGTDSVSSQCPRCRRHRIIDSQIFEEAVIQIVHLLRKPPEGPLAEFSHVLDRARAIIQTTLPDPVLGGQAAFEVVREALGRLGFPRPLKLPPSL